MSFRAKVFTFLLFFLILHICSHLHESKLKTIEINPKPEPEFSTSEIPFNFSYNKLDLGLLIPEDTNDIKNFYNTLSLRVKGGYSAFDQFYPIKSSNDPKIPLLDKYDLKPATLILQLSNIVMFHDFYISYILSTTRASSCFPSLIFIGPPSDQLDRLHAILYKAKGFSGNDSSSTIIEVTEPSMDLNMYSDRIPEFLAWRDSLRMVNVDLDILSRQFCIQHSLLSSLRWVPKTIFEYETLWIWYQKQFNENEGTFSVCSDKVLRIDFSSNYFSSILAPFLLRIHKEEKVDIVIVLVDPLEGAFNEFSRNFKSENSNLKTIANQFLLQVKTEIPELEFCLSRNISLRNHYSSHDQFHSHKLCHLEHRDIYTKYFSFETINEILQQRNGSVLKKFLYAEQLKLWLLYHSPSQIRIIAPQDENIIRTAIYATRLDDLHLSSFYSLNNSNAWNDLTNDIESKELLKAIRKEACEFFRAREKELQSLIDSHKIPVATAENSFTKIESLISFHYMNYFLFFIIWFVVGFQCRNTTSSAQIKTEVVYFGDGNENYTQKAETIATPPYNEVNNILSKVRAGTWYFYVGVAVAAIIIIALCLVTCWCIRRRSDIDDEAAPQKTKPKPTPKRNNQADATSMLRVVPLPLVVGSSVGVSSSPAYPSPLLAKDTSSSPLMNEDKGYGALVDMLKRHDSLRDQLSPKQMFNDASKSDAPRKRDPVKLVGLKNDVKQMDDMLSSLDNIVSNME